MQVKCPSCGYSADVDVLKIPDAGIDVKCPKCSSAFFFRKPTEKPIKPLECPKCGNKQEGDDTCVKCGIIFSKYKAVQRKEPTALINNHEKRLLTVAGWRRYFFRFTAFAVMASLIAYFVFFQRKEEKGNLKVVKVFQSLSLGLEHTLALKADGTVWAWGSNSRGQLGIGSNEKYQALPQQIKGLEKIRSVATGFQHSLAVTANGNVCAWGSNNYGQLGLRNTDDAFAPAIIPGLDGVLSVTAGAMSSAALKNDGTVWVWGENLSGQLGTSSFSSVNSPIKVEGLYNIVNIGAGNFHMIAVDSDGAVYTWGNNYKGQLGDGTTTNRPYAAAVQGISEVAAVAGGSSHSVVLKKDGTVWQWGIKNDNAGRQPGSNEELKSISMTPVKVEIDDVVSISAKGNNTLALKRGGSVLGWGMGYKPHPIQYGINGDATMQRGGKTFAQNRKGEWVSLDSATLKQMALVAAGWNHNCAVRNDGTISAWGENGSGQLGNGSRKKDEYLGTEVSDTTGLLK